jgi:hypothetical protein
MDKNTFDKLVKDYQIKEQFRGHLVALNDGEEESILPTDKPLHFAVNRPVDRNNLEEEVKKGNVLKTDGLEIYRHFYVWDDDTYFEKKYRMSRKMHHAIQSIMDSVHLVDVKSAPDPIPLEFKQKIKIGFKEQDLGYSQGRWIVEELKSDFDDVWVNQYIFSKKPSQKDIDIAIEIHAIKIDIQFNSGMATYYQFLEELTGTPDEIKKQFVSVYFN